MSSSDARGGPRRFFAGFVAGVAGVLALVAVLMLTVDPLGMTSGNAVCPAGAKYLYARDFKALIASEARPRTVVLGTSRVKLGFGPGALARLGPAPAVNLGVDAALPDDFTALAHEALAGGRVERVFIGVDFNTVHQWGQAAPIAPIATARFPVLERWRRGFLSYEAFRALPAALDGCRPAFRLDGAPVLDSRGGLTAGHAAYGDTREEILRQFQASARPGGETAKARLARLRALAAELRGQGIEVVLFSAPYQEGLLDIFDQLGMRGRFDRFHADLARLAREEGIAFVDLHGQAGIASLDLPPCADGGIACHYLDLTHYSPLVGERIALRLAEQTAP